MHKFLFIIGLFFPGIVFSQTLIVGRVIIHDGTPVSGVNVWCPEQNKGTSSDSTGYFELACEVPCTLEFSHVNYKKESYTLKDTRSPFIVILRNKFNNLREVVVTGRSTPGRLYSSKEGIEMIPAILGEQDILKYLATTPGIITTNALDPGIYVRGSNSCENGFLTHDMEIASPDHLTGILSTFDPFILNNSTVYKSGFPAVYNSYLSSYINMRPDPGNKQKYEGEITLGLVSSALKIKGPLVRDHTSFAASFRTSYLQTIARLYNKSAKDQKQQNFMPEYAFNDATVSIDSKLSNRWRVTAFGLFTIDGLSMKLNENVNYDFNWHTFSGNAGAWYTPANGDILHFRLGVKSAFSEGDAEGTIPVGGGNRNYSIIARIMYTHSFLDKFQWNIGGKFEQARFETANRPDAEENILIRSSDKKFNIYEIYSDISYQINNSFTCYAGLAEQEIQGGLTLYAGIFYKKMKHVKDFSSGLSTKYTALTDNMITGSGYARGFEFNLALERRKISARFNYTLSESKRKFAEINNGKSFFPPYDVKHNVVVNTSYDISTRLTFNSLWTFSSGVYTTFPVGVAVAHNISSSQNKPILVPVYTDRYNYKLPNNHRLDLSLDYTIPYKYASLKLSIGAYNVYNQSNPSFVYFKAEQTATNHTKFIPKSKVMLPFIPYISFKIKL